MDGTTDEGFGREDVEAVESATAVASAEVRRLGGWEGREEEGAR
jgi:hypothetical protein